MGSPRWLTGGYRLRLFGVRYCWGRLGINIPLWSRGRNWYLCEHGFGFDGNCWLGFLAKLRIHWRGLGNLSRDVKMIDRFPWLGLASRLPNHHVFGFRIRTGFPGDKQSSVNGDGSCAIEEGAPGPEMQIGRGIVALLAYVNAADSLFQLGDGNLRTVDTWLAGWTSQHDADAARDQGASYCIG